jgi:hypothetical protein
MEESNLTGQNKVNYVTNVCIGKGSKTIFQKDAACVLLEVTKKSASSVEKNDKIDVANQRLHFQHFSI